MIMLKCKNARTARIGIFAVAHATYWGQFEGLYENIMGYHKDFCEMTDIYCKIKKLAPTQLGNRQKGWAICFLKG